MKEKNMGNYLVNLEVIEERELFVEAKDEREAVEKVLKLFEEDYDSFDDEAYYNGTELNFKEITSCVKFLK